MTLLTWYRNASYVPYRAPAHTTCDIRVLRDDGCTVIHGSNRVTELLGPPGLLHAHAWCCHRCCMPEHTYRGTECAAHAGASRDPVETPVVHETPPQARTHSIVKRHKRHR